MRKVLVVLLAVLFSALIFANAEYYVVKSGDSLSKISEITGVSIEDLVKYNKIENPDFIKVGQRLRLMPEYTQRDLNEQMVLAMDWYQTSGEMKALAYQAFNVAKMVFDNDLANNNDPTKRAIIVDIDETILNNSPYDAGHIDTNHAYPTGWNDWCNAAQAKALPGAVEFLNYVVEKGADVYYISNRKVAVKEGTMKNLKALGFPQVTDDHVLLRTDTSDKEPRRKMVEKDHRIVLLMGDNLNDFTSVFRHKGLNERNALVDQFKNEYGVKFILLPNPIYGDWEGAIYNGNWGLSPEEKSKARKSVITKWPEQ
ncbi:5'-nucleotidase, lipoprotein e(P4) family [Marinitoga lauensis]|uniref:5'-nucleotidase, lipoprotein e(P4) family n=1 Tax=Marinitoga lauensis TaxID=2201189 RepID=UPI0010106B64|nr:5'-nucleotidase, lipoprotein e(P4) family [Marinitoga lauensis]